MSIFWIAIIALSAPPNEGADVDAAAPLSRQEQQVTAPTRVAPEKQQAARTPKSVGLNRRDGVLAQWGNAGGGQRGGGGGGMGGFPGGGMPGGQGNQDWDYGQDLVDLIQKTIAPESWDVNGGPGSIYYWKQQRAIVVRGGLEVHEQISDLVEQLNRVSH